MDILVKGNFSKIINYIIIVRRECAACFRLKLRIHIYRVSSEHPCLGFMDVWVFVLVNASATICKINPIRAR